MITLNAIKSTSLAVLVTESAESAEKHEEASDFVDGQVTSQLYRLKLSHGKLKIFALLLQLMTISEYLECSISKH